MVVTVQPCGLLVNASSRAITGVRVDKLTTDRGWPCGVACAVAAAVTTVSGVEAGAGDTVVVDVCPCGAQPAAATTAAINSAHADVCRLHARRVVPGTCPHTSGKQYALARRDRSLGAFSFG